MKISTYLGKLMLIALLFSGCGDNDEENIGRGESINDFKLAMPSNFSTLTLNRSTPDKIITLQWEPAKTGLGSAPAYRILLDQKDGDFSDPIAILTADNEGLDTKVTLSTRMLMTLASEAASNALRWTVEAITTHPNGKNTVRATNPFLLEVVVPRVGISDFEYLEPTPNQKVFVDNVRTPNEKIEIVWTPAMATEGDVKYRWLAATTPNGFEDPVVSLESDNNGTSPHLTFTHVALKNLLAGIEYEDGLYWRVEATAGDFSYSPATRFMWFEVFDIPNVYVVGSFTNGWNNNCTDALKLTNKGNGVFESVISIPAGAEFKLVAVCGSWDVNWGSPIDEDITPGEAYTLQAPGANIKVKDAGKYSLQVDFSKFTFQLTTVAGE